MAASATSGQFIRPEIHTPVQREGDIAKVPLFPNGPRQAASDAVKQELITRSTAMRDFLLRQAEEQAPHAKKLKAEQDARDEGIRLQLLAEQERERTQHEQTLQRYNSEAEKAFREEAEQVRSGEPDRNLLAAWLGWKARELHIEAAALKQRAADHQNKAKSHRRSAEAYREDALIEGKRGSSSGERLKFNAYFSEKQAAKKSEKSAAALLAGAEDVDLASKIYMDLKSDTSIIAAIGRAQSLKQSFAKCVMDETEEIIRQNERRRRRNNLLRKYWKWCFGIVVAIALLLSFSV